MWHARYDRELANLMSIDRCVMSLVDLITVCLARSQNDGALYSVIATSPFWMHKFGLTDLEGGTASPPLFEL